MPGKTLAQAAEQEVLEEAGVQGRLRDRPLGSYQHTKRRFLLGGKYEVKVVVHTLAVQREHENWPECDQRARKWMRIERAAELVPYSELSALIMQLNGAPDEPADLHAALTRRGR